jgi:hypothetical protein
MSITPSPARADEPYQYDIDLSHGGQRSAASVLVYEADTTVQALIVENRRIGRAWLSPDEARELAQALTVAAAVADARADSQP